VPDRAPFEYVILRVVPRVERGECINAGVMLICRPKRFLAAQVRFDPERLRAFDPGVDHATLEAIEAQLALVPLVAAGDPAGGRLAALDLSERWHLLSAPSSTIVQPSPVHTGLCLDPAAELDALVRELVDIGRTRHDHDGGA
jgi:hypothetical protein